MSEIKIDQINGQNGRIQTDRKPEVRFASEKKRKQKTEQLV